MANEILVGLTIGAALSGSYHAAFASAQNTVKQLGATVKDLTARHTQMGEAMQRATGKLSGGTLAAINRDYEKLGRTIEVLRIKQESLTASMARGAALRASRADLRGQFMETAGTAAVIGAPIFQSVRAAAGFQDQMRDVAITGEFSPEEEAKIGSTVRASALQWNQTQESIGSGIGKLVAGGIQNAQSLEQYAPVMAKAATATRASMDDLGSVAIALKDNLGIGAEGYEGALNMLAYAGKRGQFEIQDMAKHLPNLTPAFAGLGVTGKEAVAEIGAALQIARKGAGSNDEAANNLKNFLQKLTSTDTLKDFAKANIDLETSMTNLRAQGMTPMQSMLGVITDYMGKKGPEAAGQFQAAMAIKDDKEHAAALQRLSEAYKLGELFQDMQAMAFIRPAIANQAEMKDIKAGSMAAADKGALDIDFAKRMGTASEQFKSLKIGLAELGISVGEALLPALIDITEMAKPFLKTFGEWAKENPGWIRGIVTAGAALFGMKGGLIVLKYLVTGVLSFQNSFVTAATLISSKWTLLHAAWQTGRFAPAINGLRAVSSGLMTAGRDALAFGKSSAMGVGSKLRSLGQSAVTAGKSLGGHLASGLRVAGVGFMSAGRYALAFGKDMASGISSRLLKLGQAAMVAGKFLGSHLVSGLQLVGRVLLTVGRAMLTNPLGLALTAIAIAGYLIYRHWDKLGPVFHRVLNTIKTKLADLWGTIQELPGKFMAAGRDLVDGLVGGIQSKLGAAKESILGFGRGVKDWFCSVLGIQSPSRVFMGFGDNIALGASMGIDRSANRASQSAAMLAEHTAAAAVGAPRLGASRPDIAMGGPITPGSSMGNDRSANQVSPLTAVLTERPAAAVVSAPRLGASRPGIAMGGPIAPGASMGNDRSASQVSQLAAMLTERTAAATVGAPRLGAVRPGPAAAGTTTTIHFAPTINLPAGAGAANTKDSVSQALQLSLHELEQMIRRITDQQARRAYVGA